MDTDGITTPNQKKVIVVNPHGFCVGVARAIDTIETALKLFPTPLYCFNQIVHNRQIVEDLTSRGVVFVQAINDVPPETTLLFSAHGISPEVREAAKKRKLNVIDATCPFVAKVHNEVIKYRNKDYTILLIGHRNHDEVKGVAGEAPNHVIVIENEEDAKKVAPKNPDRVAVVTQTTLARDKTSSIFDILKKRFPGIKTPVGHGICYATTNRQFAVRELAKKVNIILVLGSRNSSNSNRLVEVSLESGCPAVLINSNSALKDAIPPEATTIGLTSGASTPELFLESILKDLADLGFNDVREFTPVEEKRAALPLPPMREK